MNMLRLKRDDHPVYMVFLLGFASSFTALNFTGCFFASGIIARYVGDKHIGIFTETGNATNFFSLNIFFYLPLATALGAFVILIEVFYSQFFRKCTFMNYMNHKISVTPFLYNPIMVFIIFFLSVIGVEGNGFGFFYVPIILILLVIETIQFFLGFIRLLTIKKHSQGV